MTAQVHGALSQARPSRVDTERFLLRRLTEPKPHVVFDRPARPLGLARFASRARSRGVHLDRRTRVMHSTRAIGINGEYLAGRTALDGLRRLADRRGLAPADPVPAGLWPTLHDWYRAGWLHLSDRP
jgi:50S ribosomal protein L16 3-hydroxylase